MSRDPRYVDTPYRIDEDGSTTYVQYYDDSPSTGGRDVTIRKYYTDGTVTTVTEGQGRWADRATITYSAVNG